MKEVSRKIEIGQGFGAIKFGMNREEIKKVAGEPDEIENYNHDEVDGANAEAWHYDEPEISFAFEEFNDWNLSSIAVSSHDFELNGKKLMGLKVDEVSKILETLNIGEVDIEDYSTEDAPDLQLITIEEAGLNLWFDEGILTEIQWSPLWDEEDEDE
jgi:hypothetical protein